MQDDPAENPHRFQEAVGHRLEKWTQSKWFKRIETSNKMRADRFGKADGALGFCCLFFAGLCFLGATAMLDHPLEDVFAYIIVGLIFMVVGWRLIRK